MAAVTTTKGMLTREELRVLVAYPDPISKDGLPYTIGIGHAGPDVYEGLVWTDAQVDSAYALDEKRAIAGCLDNFYPWWSTLNPARQAVLVGMAFQMGIHGLLGFRQALDAIRDEHWEHAAVCMLDSKWARQTPARAGRMARQIATGDWQ